MNQLMLDVSAPIPGQLERELCILFRPAVPEDEKVLKIEYGTGCSAIVSDAHVRREKQSNFACRSAIGKTTKTG